jgi:hypothetical protein
VCRRAGNASFPAGPAHCPDGLAGLHQRVSDRRRVGIAGQDRRSVTTQPPPPPTTRITRLDPQSRSNCAIPQSTFCALPKRDRQI